MIASWSGVVGVLGVTYGWAWILTQAKVTHGVRAWLAAGTGVRGWGSRLLSCLVCTGCWLVVPVAWGWTETAFLSASVPVSVSTWPIWVGLWVAVSWPWARALGDVD